MPISLTLKVPVILNVINRDIETIENKLIFVPYDTPKNIESTLMAEHSKWNTSDKLKLQKHFDIDVISSEIYGGDDGVDDMDIKFDEFDEDSLIVDDMTLTFDEEDIRNLTDTGSSTIHQSSSKQKVDVTHKKITSKTRLTEFLTRSSTTLFESDTIATFKQKVYIETGIPPYRQHIWFSFNGKAYQLNYRIKHDTYQSIDISNTLYVETVLEDIPVDSLWYASKDFIRVESNDHMTIHQLISKYQVTEFHLIDVASFINEQNYNSVRQIVLSDSYAYELIYWGFIIKYFPMMSLSIFKEYLKNPNDVKIQYPHMHPDRHRLIEQYEMEKMLLLDDIPEFNSNIIKMNIINSTVNIKSKYINTDDSLILRNLFDMFALNEMINTCVCNTTVDIHRITLIKKFKDAVLEYSHIPLNTIQYSINIPKYGKALFQLNKLGNYKIVGEWVDGSELMFSNIFKVLDKHIMPVVNTINSFTSVVSTRPIEPITLANSHFSNINMFLYIKRKVTTAQFLELRKYINKFITAGIMERVDADNHILHYYQLKGVFMHDMVKYRTNAPLYNEYSILYDANSRSKWNIFITKKKSIKIIRRFSDIKIEIEGLREEEFNTWFVFLQLLIKPILKKQKGDDVSNVADKPFKGNMKIRHMKEMDPVLYDLKKIYGKKIVYSQICQRPHQPHIHDAPGAGRSKYWNFTTEEPMWYSCPDQKYPYLYFKIGVHPLHYCMPCCKKKDIPNDEKAMQAKIYKQCMENHTFTRERKTATRSRYVKTYSKFLHPGRISRLPEDTLEPLLHDNFALSSSGIGEECIKDTGYYIFGVPQHGQSVNNIGFIYCMAHAFDMKIEKFIEQSIAYINSNNSWTFLLDGNITHHFATKKELISEITSTLTQDKLSIFTRWNELFIGIVKLYWTINVVLFVDHGFDSSNATTLAHDANIYLYVTNNILYLHDYFVHKKSVIIINRGETYYPIYMLYTHVYFKSGLIDKRMYEHGSPTITAISNILQNYLSKSVKTHTSIDLHMMKYFEKHNKDITIDTLFINDVNMCYGIIMLVDKKKAYIPIKNSMYQSGYKITFDIMGPDHATEWSLLKILMGRINQSIAEYSASKNRLLSDDEKIPIMQRVDPIYPYLVHDEWAIHDKKILGTISQYLLFYVTPKSIDKSCIKRTISYIIDPHAVNQAIKNREAPAEDRRSKILNTAIYNQYLYQLLFLTFIDIIHTHRNVKLRDSIKKVFRENKKKTSKFTTNIIEELRKILHDYPRDLQSIVKMMINEDPEKILDNSFLELDKYVITELISLPVKQCREKVCSILQKYIVIGEPSFKNDIPNMLTSCINADNEFSPYCKTKKLIIPKKKLDEYIDILVMDIKNPLKTKYLTLYTFIPRSIDYFDFINRPNEKIYITL